MKNGNAFSQPQASAAGLNKMEFPALRKNPFLIKKKADSPMTHIEGDLRSFKDQVQISQNTSKISHNKNFSLNLSPAKNSQGLHITGKSGVTSCFTADTIERLLEETPSFAISGEYPTTFNRSRYSTQGPKAPEMMTGLQNQLSSVSKMDYQEQQSRKSSAKKFRPSQSREKSVSRGKSISRGGGSALRSNVTGASPKRPPLKVYQDFMKDI